MSRGPGSKFSLRAGIKAHPTMLQVHPLTRLSLTSAAVKRLIRPRHRAGTQFAVVKRALGKASGLGLDHNVI